MGVSVDPCHLPEGNEAESMHGYTASRGPALQVPSSTCSLPLLQPVHQSVGEMTLGVAFSVLVGTVSIFERQDCGLVLLIAWVQSLAALHLPSCEIWGMSFDFSFSASSSANWNNNNTYIRTVVMIKSVTIRVYKVSRTGPGAC